MNSWWENWSLTECVWSILTDYRQRKASFWKHILIRRSHRICLQILWANSSHFHSWKIKIFMQWHHWWARVEKQKQLLSLAVILYSDVWSIFLQEKGLSCFQRNWFFIFCRKCLRVMRSGRKRCSVLPEMQILIQKPFMMRIWITGMQWRIWSSREDEWIL